MVVASWFPLDLANARLHRALLASVADARPDLGVTPEILDCVESLKSADDLTASQQRVFESQTGTFSAGMFWARMFSVRMLM